MLDIPGSLLCFPCPDDDPCPNAEALAAVLSPLGSLTENALLDLPPSFAALFPLDALVALRFRTSHSSSTSLRVFPSL
jgi:hypothetical protein